MRLPIIADLLVRYSQIDIDRHDRTRQVASAAHEPLAIDRGPAVRALPATSSGPHRGNIGG